MLLLHLPTDLLDEIAVAAIRTQIDYKRFRPVCKRLACSVFAAIYERRRALQKRHNVWLVYNERDIFLTCTRSCSLNHILRRAKLPYYNRGRPKKPIVCSWSYDWWGALSIDVDVGHYALRAKAHDMLVIIRIRDVDYVKLS